MMFYFKTTKMSHKVAYFLYGLLTKSDPSLLWGSSKIFLRRTMELTDSLMFPPSGAPISSLSWSSFEEICKCMLVLLLLIKALHRLRSHFGNKMTFKRQVVEWSARLARKRAFRVRRLLTPLSMMHILLL